MYPTLVSPEWLYSHFNSTDIRIFDTTFHEKESLKRARHIFYKTHIRNAFYLLLRDEMTKFNQIPAPSIFTRLLTAYGLTRGVHAILYDYDGVSALRAWWLLQYFSHQKISILIGGLKGWQDRDFPVDVKTVVKVDSAPETAFHAAPRPDLLRTKYQIQQYFDALQGRQDSLQKAYQLPIEQADAIEQYSLAVDQKSIIAKLDVGFLEEKTYQIAQLVNADTIWQQFLDENGLFQTDLLAVKRVFRQENYNLELPMTVYGNNFYHLLHVVLAAFLCQGKGIDGVSCCIEDCVIAEYTHEHGLTNLLASGDQFIESGGPK